MVAMQTRGKLTPEAIVTYLVKTVLTKTSAWNLGVCRVWVEKKVDKMSHIKQVFPNDFNELGKLKKNFLYM